MESLGVVNISKVGAAQRAGRAGRTGPGKCYRLYNKEAFEAMADETEPEIKRTNLANVVLYLKVLGVVDVLSFEFLDPPPEVSEAPSRVGCWGNVPFLVTRSRLGRCVRQSSIRDALKQLFFLGAIDIDGVVTPLGRRMAEYPLEPKLSRMLIQSRKLGVEQDVHAIGALLSVERVFYEPPRRKGDGEEGNPLAAKAAEAHAAFFDDKGDHFAYLRVCVSYRMGGGGGCCLCACSPTHHMCVRVCSSLWQVLPMEAAAQPR